MEKEIELYLSKISNVKFEGVDHGDYPDYCDAYIVSADYDGREMTEEEIQMLDGEEFADWKYFKLMDYLH